MPGPRLQVTVPISLAVRRHLAVSVLVVVLSLDSIAVSSQPVPKWRCKPKGDKFNKFRVYTYAGFSKLNESVNTCQGFAGHVPADVGECFKGYANHINASQVYAVLQSHTPQCYSPCSGSNCISNCHGNPNVNVVCQTYISFMLERTQGSGVTTEVGRACIRVCPVLQAIPNGVVLAINTSLTLGEVKCFEGFMLVGIPSATCEQTGAWRTAGGECQLQIKDVTVNATAEIRCFQNNTLIGDPSVRCKINGTWSSSSGSCEEISTVTSRGDSATNGEITVTTSSWLGAIPSKIVIAIAAILLALVLILLAAVISCARRIRRYEVRDRSSSDETGNTAITATKHRLQVSSTEGENDTYDVLRAPASATLDQPPNENNLYDHLSADSKLPGLSRSCQASSASSQPSSETPMGAYTSITMVSHGLGTKTQDRQPAARIPSLDAYTEVDLKTKMPRPDQEQSTMELTTAIDEIDEILGEPVLPPRLDCSL